LNLTIEKLIYGGDGLARLPADDHGRGKAVFVPYVLEGERIDARVTDEKPGFARAQAETILQPSPNRIEPHCPYFLRCGGCHYQHATYEHQLQTKASILRENLARIARMELDVPLQVHASPPWNYRNRTRMQVRMEGEFVLGYYRHNSHFVLPVEECPISSPLINRAISVLWKLGRDEKITTDLREIEFFADAADQRLLLELYFRGEWPEKQFTALADALRAEMPEIAGVIAFRSPVSMHAPSVPVPAEFIVADRHITYETQAAFYRVSAGAFFQTNRHMIDELVSAVTTGISGNTALELYAGVGLFASVLKRNFERVIAVESSPLSFSDLQYNSPANVKAVRATTDQYLERSKTRADLVVVDPPRGGLGKTVAMKLAQLGPRHLTYVSCDPATLARDLIALKEAGYRFEQAHLLDLFPQTFHIETVLRLVRHAG